LGDIIDASVSVILSVRLSVQSKIMPEYVIYIRHATLIIIIIVTMFEIHTSDGY